MNAASDLQVLTADINRCPFHRVLDIDVVSHNPEDNRLRLGITIRPELLRTVDGGGLHGGVIASLIDVAAAYAVERTAGPGGATVTLSIDYLRPVTGVRVEAEARIVRKGRTQVWSDIELFDGDRLAAIGRARFAFPGAA